MFKVVITKFTLPDFQQLIENFNAVLGIKAKRTPVVWRSNSRGMVIVQVHSSNVHSWCAYCTPMEGREQPRGAKVEKHKYLGILYGSIGR